MIALSPPPFFSTFVWPSDQDPAMSHETNSTVYRETDHQANDHSYYSDVQSFLQYSPAFAFSQTSPGLGEFKPSSTELVTGGSDDHATVANKKINHNASERDRRRRINILYSSLRSLLPAADQKRKLSIPATVSRVLKYIPELQRQVERLIHTKEELTSKVKSRKEDSALLLDQYQKQGKGAISRKSSFAVSATPLGDTEVVIHICTTKVNKIQLSAILLNLEEEEGEEGDGLILLNSSCFASFADRVFYNLHLQAQGTQRVDFAMLSKKLSSLYD